MSTSREPVVFLHIGAPKSGTTYLQSRLSAEPSSAAAAGLCWVLPWSRQTKAAREVKQLRQGGSLAPDGPWSSLVRDIREWNGRCALISMEWLMNAADHQVAAALASLSPCRVEVVCTARDLIRGVPGAWQESMQNFRTWPWDEYVRAVTDESGSTHPGALEFWSQQDVPTVLRRWGEHVGLDRVHLVTVPPRGGDPGVLWQRFCEVLGVDGSVFPEPLDGNPSLGAVSASVMQRFNVAAKKHGLPHPKYVRYAKHMLAKQVLASRRRDEPPIALSDEVRARLVRRSERMVADLRELPVHLVGTLDDLVPKDGQETGRDPTDVRGAEMFEAALDGLVGMVLALAARDRRPVRSAKAPVQGAKRGVTGTVHRAVRRRVTRFRSTRP